MEYYMYNATIYKVFSASPSDVKEEREIIPTIINEWNITHSKEKKTVLQPQRWEIDVYPSFGDNPQEVINEQVLKDVDLLVAIFWTRIGTPTEKHRSGTVEEIKEHVEAKKPAMIYFSNKPIDPQKLDHKQYADLQEFKKWCEQRAINKNYSSIEEFEKIFRIDLALMISNDRYFKKEDTGVSDDILKKNIFDNNKQSRDDLISFFNDLHTINEEKDGLDKFYKRIGRYRFKKIEGVLRELDILLVIQTDNTGPLFKIRPGFRNSTEDDIQQIIKDIELGNYDYLLG